MGGLATASVLCLLGVAGGTAGAGNPVTKTQAKKDLLTVHDLPKGWTASKSSNSNSSFPGAAQLATCLGVPTSLIASNEPSVSSPQFSSPTGVITVDDSLSLDPSATYARKDFASLANPKTPSCLTTVLNGAAKPALTASLGTAFTVGTIAVSRLPASDFGPHAADFALFFPVTKGGTTLNVETIVVDFAKGSEEQNLVFTGLATSIPVSLTRKVSTVADSRL
jgi:hypothetical protein